jgi:hypothetical protein
MRSAQICILPILTVLFASPALAQQLAPPELNLDYQYLGRPYVNPRPRPAPLSTDVTTGTTIDFELLVPNTNGTIGKINPNTITVDLAPALTGTGTTMLDLNQVFGSGFSGEIIDNIYRDTRNGVAVYIVPETPLDFDKDYYVRVSAETFNGDTTAVPTAWRFTTRNDIANIEPTLSANLTDQTVSWDGWFFTGMIKPNFNTSRMFDQLESYDLMDTVTAINPHAWSLQRDRPLNGDFWRGGGGVWDGNPNVVRERETRRIRLIRNEEDATLLTVENIDEAPLYCTLEELAEVEGGPPCGVMTNRPLDADFLPGQVVSVGDGEKFEIVNVMSVDNATNTVEVTKLTNTAWVLGEELEHNHVDDDDPDTPDHFSKPETYLRKYNPVGTPVYYWKRVDDEWDIVHGQHGRRLVVCISYVPVDLAKDPVPSRKQGEASISPPKSYLQWHEFIREVTFHLIERYGDKTLDWYWSVGNEPNYSTSWSGTRDEFYEFYDYTANAILTAFEDPERGLGVSTVQIGGLEPGGATGGHVTWVKKALYHMSGAADDPDASVVEQNFACENPDFEGKRAQRVEAICEQYEDKGSPIDFVSVHEYQRSEVAVKDITEVRDAALDVDPDYYDDLNVTSFEAGPFWQHQFDPAAHAIYQGNGYFPTWCADWMQRMVATAKTKDPRYARHESILTVWPHDYNSIGWHPSVTGLMRVDDDWDGEEDRIATIRKAVFNYIELLARMSHELAPLPAQDVAGIRVSGVRSASPGSHAILLYSHDMQDTESREDTVFDVQLDLDGVPWPVTTVRRWRVDKDHSSPYRELQALPFRGGRVAYRPAQICDLEANDGLAEDGAPQDHDASFGRLELSVPVAVNGVTFLELVEADGDEIPSSEDNCILVANPDQRDSNLDGYGNACDADFDDDGDVDEADAMLFEAVFGSVEGDGSYDPDMDCDGDGIIGEPDSTCLQNGMIKRAPGPSGLATVTTPPCNADADADGIRDEQDNCRLVANPRQRDSNGDGIGNFCDADLDNDGMLETADGDDDWALFQSSYGSPTPDPDADFDGDGSVAAIDSYLFSTQEEAAWEPPGPSGLPCSWPPHDGSSPCVAEDADFDADGVPDYRDNCVTLANGPAEDDQANADRDGFGNRCDGDYNNDGIVDILDTWLIFPFSDEENSYCSPNPECDPQYDARLDHDSNGCIDTDDWIIYVSVANQIGPSGLACANADEPMTPCPTTAEDLDGDGILNTSDNCLVTPNTEDDLSNQVDTDGDGIGNACDADYDNSGIKVNLSDFSIFKQAEGMSLGDEAYNPDVDSDGDDSIGDSDFAIFKSLYNKHPGPSGLACADASGATAPCYVQTGCGDTDGDHLVNAQDNCVLLRNASTDASNQVDTDGDGIGNACDADYDNSGNRVNLSDFSIFKQAEGMSLGDEGYNPDVDSDADDNIGDSDFAMFKSFYMEHPGPSGLACADASGATAPCYIQYGSGDTDGDHVVNDQDNCVLHRNGPAELSDQIDSDGDGYGNACDADYDNIGKVSLTDFSIHMQAEGKSAGEAGYNACVDLDGDDTIGDSDMEVFQSLYNKHPGPSGLVGANASGVPPCDVE